MGKIGEFFSDWYRPILGGRKYEDWKKQSLSLQKVKIRNKKLALELENECKTRGGFLTYAEYLQIEQFGRNGYHATHKDHGFTPTYKNWSETVMAYLQKNNIHEIVEFGPGNGNLAHDLFELCEEENFKLIWNAVEIGDSFRRKLELRFAKQPNKKYLGHLVKSINDLPPIQKALIISSFCMDSIPPECLTNTTRKPNSPNTLIGVRVKDGVLQEFILSEENLSTKNIRISIGIITSNNTSYDLSSWKLSPMQRAYPTINSFQILIDAVKKIKKPSFLIIDELRVSPQILRSDHILSPLYLNVKNRYHFNPHVAYERAGDMLYYFPIFLDSIVSVLKNLGLTNIKHDVEPKLAAEMSGKDWIPTRKNVLYLCYAILADGNSPGVPTTVTVSYPIPQKL